ncbi:MAG: penicillin-binding transpeptidase domain-containing protein, partial [Mesorhizobium sp.]
MRAWIWAAFVVTAVMGHAGVVQAATVCTILADAATGDRLVAEGDCDRRVTPASTFKIAIALMGYDDGFLKDEHSPKLPFRKGYPSWVAAWKADQDPTSWIANSVVWYSQQVTRHLGVEPGPGHPPEPQPPEVPPQLPPGLLPLVPAGVPRDPARRHLGEL